MSLQERDGEVVIEYDETVFRIEDAADPDELPQSDILQPSCSSQSLQQPEAPIMVWTEAPSASCQHSGPSKKRARTSIPTDRSLPIMGEVLNLQRLER